MVRCWIYSAGPDQCQCYNVDDENLADLAAQAQFLEDFRAQRAANPAYTGSCLICWFPPPMPFPCATIPACRSDSQPRQPAGVILTSRHEILF